MTFGGTLSLLVPPLIHPIGETVLTNNIIVILELTIKPFMFGYKRTS